MLACDTRIPFSSVIPARLTSVFIGFFGTTAGRNFPQPTRLDLISKLDFFEPFFSAMWPIAPMIVLPVSGIACARPEGHGAGDISTGVRLLTRSPHS